MKKTIASALLALLVGCNQATSSPIDEKSACELLDAGSLQNILAANIELQTTLIDDFERRLSGVASRCKVLFVDDPAPTTFAEQFKQRTLIFSLYTPESFAKGNSLMEDKGKKPTLDFERHWSNLSRNQKVDDLARGQGFIREVSVGKMKETQGLLRHDDLLVVISVANAPADTAQKLLTTISEHGKF